MAPSSLPLSTDRLLGDLNRLAEFSDAPAPAVTRVVYSDQDQASRRWLIERFQEAGLEVRVDPIGNTFARWQGSDPSLPALATGSHTDAIPHSGRYDGTVGVLGGLEAIRALRDSGYKPHRSLEVILFTAEEPTRFGLGCFGSRALAGVLSPDGLRGLRDPEGRTLEELRQEAGFIGPLEDVALPKGTYHAFVELHIEQGPLLEADGIPIGAVTAIAAPASFRFRLEGSGGHAGAVLMPDRKDALCAASEVTLAIERAARESASPDTVATVGCLTVHPFAINSIPSRVEMTLDLRDIRLETRDAAFEAIQAALRRVETERGVLVHQQTINRDDPAICDPAIVSAITATCEGLGLSTKRMVSRAYHDSLFMARICATSMIFIPCRKGYSHRPDEYASPEALRNGVAVLAGTLARLSRE